MADDDGTLAESLEYLESRLSDYETLQTNLGLAAEAIAGLLWLFRDIVDANDLALSDDADDVLDRVDQIAHLIR